MKNTNSSLTVDVQWNEQPANVTELTDWASKVSSAQQLVDLTLADADKRVYSF